GLDALHHPGALRHHRIQPIRHGKSPLCRSIAPAVPPARAPARGARRDARIPYPRAPGPGDRTARWNTRCLIASVPITGLPGHHKGVIMNPISAVQSEPRSDDAADATGLIRGLGWFGVSVGLTELAIPRTL